MIFRFSYSVWHLGRRLQVYDLVYWSKNSIMILLAWKRVGPSLAAICEKLILVDAQQ